MGGIFVAMSELERRVFLGAAGLAGAAYVASRAAAGPLSPPPGTVISTGRTLTEIYNRIPPAGTTAVGLTAIPGGTSGVSISAPGSYILTGNLSSNDTSVITISSPDVTLDLNGYTVSSTNVGLFAAVISLDGFVDRTAIRNGKLVGSTNAIAGNSVVAEVMLEDLWMSGQRSTGINLNAGNQGRHLLRRCHVVRLGAAALPTETLTNLTGFVISGPGVRVEDCSVSAFAYAGLGTPTRTGIRINNLSGFGGVLVSHCSVSSATAATGNGLLLSGTAVYRDCTSMNFSTAFSGGTNGGGNTSV